MTCPASTSLRPLFLVLLTLWTAGITTPSMAAAQAAKPGQEGGEPPAVMDAERDNTLKLGVSAAAGLTSMAAVWALGTRTQTLDQMPPADVAALVLGSAATGTLFSALGTQWTGTRGLGQHGRLRVTIGGSLAGLAAGALVGYPVGAVVGVARYAWTPAEVCGEEGPCSRGDVTVRSGMGSMLVVGGLGAALGSVLGYEVSDAGSGSGSLISRAGLVVLPGRLPSAWGGGPALMVSLRFR